MSTCKDCVHYEVCKWWESYSGEYEQMCCEWCNSFKNKNFEKPVYVYRIVYDTNNSTNYIRGIKVDNITTFTNLDKAEQKLKKLNRN